MYFIADRVDHMNNTSSMGNWRGMLNWLHRIYGVSPTYSSHQDFYAYCEALGKQFGTSKDTRLPFTIDHIHTYLCSLGVSVKTRASVNINKLLKAVIVLIYFFTMCRPCELVFSPWGNKKPGLVFDNIKLNTLKNNKKFVNVDVYYHKTKSNNQDPKHTFITDTSCSKLTCKCHVLNPYKLLSAYIQRRLKSRIVLTSENVFVWNDMKKVTTKDITMLVKEIISANSIPNCDSHRYTSYSLKIGGATLACGMGVDHVLLLKYVGWSDKFLSDSSISYIRPDSNTLITIPFKMIHGYDNPLFSDSIKSFKQGMVFDPWTKNRWRKRNSL